MKEFKLTDKQWQQRLSLTSTMHSMNYGGSRSGKTFGICRLMVVRAMKCKSRHLAVRLKFNHAKTSLWYETFPKVFDLAFPGLKVKPNKSDWFYKLPNGSEIWIGGLDEKERVEKILGKEYSTLYFNECSQIPYTSVQVALTRLAEKNEILKRAWYDENPPTKRHWSYSLFMKGLDPETLEPIPNPLDYNHILMNPEDNLENIDETYVKGILGRLPERQKARFLRGEFTDDASGNIYYAFDRSRHASKPCPRLEGIPINLGMDFNVNPHTHICAQVREYDLETGDRLELPVLRIFAEGFLKHSNTKAAAEHINHHYPGRWTVVPDSTGSRRQTSAESGQSDHQILRDHGFTVPFVRNPFRMDRYNEVNALFEADRIEIDPSCKELIADLEQVIFLEGSNMPDERDPMRVHISDALGYLVHYLFPLAKIESGAQILGDR